MAGRFDVAYDTVLEHARVLTERYPDRYAGTSNAAAAAEYIQSVCREHGVPCELLRPPMYLSLPKSSSVAIVRGSAEDKIQSVPFANSAATEPEGITAELVYVGSGSEQDFARTNVAGRIALVESSYSPPRQEKIRLSAAHGAAGILVMHWGDEESELMVRGNAKAIWGNPTLTDVPQLPRIPAVGISRKSGTRLIKELASGPILCRLSADAEQSWSNEARLPLIRIAAPDPTSEIIIVGGHYDSWAGGATDNAVGNGFKLELAKRLFEKRGQLARSIWIAFWPGHETTTMSGSTWFVDHFWDELTSRGAVYINVDTLGLAGSSEMLIHCSPELAPFASSVAQDTLGEAPRIATLAKTGDQSFFGIGIPSLYGRTGYTQETLRATHNATLGWWNHSHPSQDNMDKVDGALVEKAGMVMENWVHAYSTIERLPAQFSRVALEVSSRLEELLPIAPSELGLDRLKRRADSLLADFTTFEAKATTIPVATYNTAVIRISRVLTPVFASVAGKYGQDPYGLSALKTRVPCLYDLESLPRHDHPNELLTGLVRERNRVSDAIAMASELVQAAITAQA